MIIEIESPVTIGDKVYKTTKDCNIIVGEIKELIIIKQFSERNSEYVRFDTEFPDKTTMLYDTDDINKLIFLSKEELIKHLSK